MILTIEVERWTIPFRLDWDHMRWHSIIALEEGDFPLVTMIDGKRYELYSDDTFAEVEK